jgi:hypothetical protein
MNVAEAVQNILILCSRPDKSAEALKALNYAISYCTLQGDFKRDMVEASIAVNPTLYGATVSLASLTRFRRFTYVKPTGVKYYLSPLSGEKIFTPKNNMQPNVYYVAGTSLTYTLSALTPTLEVSYLTYPITLDTVTNTTHWMLDLMPYAIIDIATSRIFQDIGDEASSTRFKGSGMELYLITRRDLNQGG